MNVERYQTAHHTIRLYNGSLPLLSLKALFDALRYDPSLGLVGFTSQGSQDNACINYIEKNRASKGRVHKLLFQRNPENKNMKKIETGGTSMNLVRDILSNGMNSPRLILPPRPEGFRNDIFKTLLWVRLSSQQLYLLPTSRSHSHGSLEGIIGKPLKANDASRQSNPGTQSFRGQIAPSHLLYEFLDGGIRMLGLQGNDGIGRV